MQSSTAAEDDEGNRNTDANETSAPTRHMFDRVRFGPVSIDVVSMTEAIDTILELAVSRGGIVVTPNLDHLVLFEREPAFAATYARASLVLADGKPLIMLSKLLRLPLREQIAGSDLIVPLAQAAGERGVRVFLFGSTDDVGAAAEVEFRRLAPGIDIVGRASPWFDPSRGENPEIDDAIAQLNASDAQLVLLAFGAPKQEQFLDRYQHQLPAAAWLCGGAALDFVAGKVPRAPAFVRRVGMEWAYRFIQEPRRLWRRYFVRDAAAVPLLLRVVVRRLRGVDLVERHEH